MRLNCKASLAFKKLRAEAKPAFGQNVINSLTPPPLLSSKKTEVKKEAAVADDLPIPLAELTDINTDLAAAVSDSLTGAHTARATLKNAIIAWDYAFGRTAEYISAIAEGDPEIIRKAGYVPTKTESSPSQKPGAPINFKATINGTKGAIIASSQKAVPGALFYLYSALPDGATINYVNDTIIITIGEHTVYLSASTGKQTELYNLPSGTPFNVSMVAVNSAGNGPASASQKVIPQ